MKLPFTIEAFLRVFEKYNTAIWPLQVFLFLLAIVGVFITLTKSRRSGQIIASILAFLWIWMGFVYHIMYFAFINRAAYIFGSLFIIEGILFIYFGFYKRNISFHFRPDIYGIAGSFLILFALIIYPVLGYFLGHKYPSAPTFGLPCPTTIFTFGILLFADNIVPIVLILIPFLWSLIGVSAAFALGIKEDIGLLISGVLFLVLVSVRNRSIHKKSFLAQQSL